MSSFITRFLANMTTKESKNTTPASESRPRRHERSSSKHQHQHRSRHDYYRSSYVYDSDSESDDEPLSENSLMLDLGPEYSPKTMSTISFPSPIMRGSTVLFESEDLDASPQHIEVHKPAPAATNNSNIKRKPVQYYDAPAAQSEANYRQQRGRSSSRSSSGSQEREKRERRSSGSTGFTAGPQRWW